MKKLRDALLKAKSIALRMKLGRKIATFCLALLITGTSLVSVFPMTASAATRSAEVAYYPGTGSGWGFDFFKSGNGGLPAAYDPTPGRSSYVLNYMDRNSGWQYYKSGGKYAYCVKIGGLVSSGDVQTRYSLNDFYPNIEHQRRMRAAIIYSFKGTSKYGYSKAYELAASQCLVWILSADFTISGDWAKGVNSSLSDHERIFLDHILVEGKATNNKTFLNCYKKMRQDIMSHRTLADNLYDSSDQAKAHKIKLEYSSGTKTIDGMKSEGYWYATVNMGTYRSCFDYSPINNLKGVSVTESDNNITIYATYNTGLHNLLSKSYFKINKDRSINGVTDLTSYSPIGVWKNSSTSNQAMVSYDVKGIDPVSGYMAFDVEASETFTVKKTATEDGKTYTVTSTANKNLNSNVKFKIYRKVNDQKQYVNAWKPTYLMDDGEQDGPNTWEKTWRFARFTSTTTGATFVLRPTGYFMISRLPAGTYFIEEVSTSANWVKIPQAISFTISDDEAKDMTINNTPQKGTATITKTASDNDGTTYTVTSTKNKTLNSAVTFKIKDSDGYWVNATAPSENGTSTYVYTRSDSTATGQNFKLNSDGMFSIRGLPVGKYTLIETATAAGYTKSADVTFTVEYNKTTSKTVNNKEYGALKVTKTINGQKVSGYQWTTWIGSEKKTFKWDTLCRAIRFTIKDSSGNYVKATGGSDYNGNYVYSSKVSTSANATKFALCYSLDKANNCGEVGAFVIDRLPAGTYYIQEVKADTSDYSFRTIGVEPLSGNVKVVISDTKKTTQSINNEYAGTLYIQKKMNDSATSIAEYTFTDGEGNTYDWADLCRTIRFRIKDSSGNYLKGVHQCPEGDSYTGRYRYDGTTTKENATLFALCYKDTGDLHTVAGTLAIHGVPAGTYTIEEVANAGQPTFAELGVTASANVTVNVTSNAMATKQIINYVDDSQEPVIYVEKDFSLVWGQQPTNQDYLDCAFTLKDSSNNYYILKCTSTANGTYEVTGTTKTALSATRMRLGTTSKTAKITGITNGTYTITETLYGDTVVPKQQTVTATINVESAPVKVFQFTNVEASVPFKVYKRTEGMVNVSGISLLLTGTTDRGLTYTASRTTGADGSATFSGVPCGTYTIYEVAQTVPDGYVPVSPSTVGSVSVINPTKVVVKENMSDVVIINDEMKGWLNVTKETEDGKNISGIEFTVKGTSDTGRAISVSSKTNSEGRVTFSDLPIGTYTVYEGTVPVGSLTADSEKVKIEYQKGTDLVVHNDYTHVEIYKVDADKYSANTVEQISGVHLQLIDVASGNVIADWTTDGSPKSFVGVLGVGNTYKIHEVSPAPGYQPMTEDYEFTVSETADVQSQYVTNQKNELHVSKRDITDGSELPGAKLQILKEDGSVYEQWTSDEYDHIVYGIPAGKYRLVETSAPDGYLIANAIDFEIFADSTVEKVEMVDDVNRISITKWDYETNQPLAGAALKMTAVKNGAAVDLSNVIVAESESAKVSASEVSWTTESTPAVFKRLPDGEYTIVEISAPTGYQLSDKKITFTVTKGVISEQDGELDFYNSESKVHVSKEYSFVISPSEKGAQFTLACDITVNWDEVVFEGVQNVDIVEQKAIFSTPAPTGNVVYDMTIKKLPDGNYTLTETYTPDGYLKHEEEVSFSVVNGYFVYEGVTYNGEDEGEIAIDNQYSEFSIEKVDENGIRLVGAELALYNEAGDEILRWTSDEDVKVIKGLPYGTYTLKELKAPNGFNTAREITFVHSGEANGEVYTLVNNRGIVMPETGDVGTVPLTIIGLTLFAIGFGYTIITAKKKERKGE